jgi:hypothetical protein
MVSHGQVGANNPHQLSILQAISFLLLAYRFHDMDTLPFHGGFRFVWRNGDAVDPVTGHKCFTETGGNVVGQPTQSNVSYYAWVYLF